LSYIQTQIPLVVHEIPSGTPVLDWEVPLEWTVRGASIRTLTGQEVVNFSNNNLHLVQYSRPVDRVIQVEELQKHLHSIPEQPDLVPYRTAYYSDTWGFCLVIETGWR
jgi:aminopeptidase-like protein